MTPAQGLEYSRTTALRDFGRTVALALMAWVGILVIFQTTALEVASIWMRSDTFAHGLVVLPIIAWIFWRERFRLSQVPARPTLTVLPLLALSAFGWLLGEIASAAALSHLALAAMLICAAWSVFGHRLAWAACFPLGFLLFGVPIGEFLMPWLMQSTADVTIAALRLTGVPVYREGLNFVIPTGNWSVVEACSGIRYLIASIMVGALFAWLNYRSPRRRILFVLASILVPLVANWGRAYLIVMIGHLSGNEYATGADHLVYGWVFFGVVILLLFWIGSWWGEADLVATGRDLLRPPEHALFSPRLFFIISAMLLTAAATHSALSYLQSRPATLTTELVVPKAMGDWTLQDAEKVSPWTPSYSGFRAELNTCYQSPQTDVSLYAALYANQSPDHELVQWANQLVPTTQRRWTQGERSVDRLRIADTDVQVMRTEIMSPDTRRHVWLWYWLGDRNTSSDTTAKLDLLRDRLMGRSDASALIVIHVPADRPISEQREQVQRFIDDNWLGIDRMLKDASGVRE